jgi:hypothetical protein
MEWDQITIHQTGRSDVWFPRQNQIPSLVSTLMLCYLPDQQEFHLLVSHANFIHIYYPSGTKELSSAIFRGEIFQQSLLVLSLGFAATSNGTVLCNVGSKSKDHEAKVRFCWQIWANIGPATFQALCNWAIDASFLYGKSKKTWK